jgi:hypothetical protein
MKKKRKHKKARARSANRKEIEGLQRKQFLKSLQNMMEVLGIGNLYTIIPHAQKKLLAKTRFRNFRVEAEEGAAVNKKDLRFIKEIISLYLKNVGVAFGPDEQMIYLHEFFTAGYTFMAHFKDIDESSFEGADELKAAALEFERYFYQEDNPFNKHLLNLIRCMLLFTSRPDRCIYLINLGAIPVYSGNKPVGLSVCIYIRSQKPVKSQVTLEEKKRITYRFGVPDCAGEGITWVTLPRDYLLNKYAIKHKPLDLYIQSHALHRFDERTRGLGPEGILRLSLNDSLEFPTIVEYKDGKGLLAFTYEEKRFGYFAFTFIDDNRWQYVSVR